METSVNFPSHPKVQGASIGISTPFQTLLRPENMSSGDCNRSQQENEQRPSEPEDSVACDEEQFQEQSDNCPEDVDKYVDHIEICDEFPCNRCYISIERISEMTSNLDRRNALADHIAEKKHYCQIFGTLWLKLVDNITDNEKPESQTAFRASSCFIVIGWKLADASEKFCKKLQDVGSLGMMLDWFTSEKENIGESTVEDLMNNVIKLLYNCCRLVDSIRRPCRVVVEIIEEFAKSDDPVTQACAFLTLSYIVDKHEAHKFSVNEDSLNTLLTLLKQALTDANHRASVNNISFSALELVQGVEQLAINDNNKILIAEKGGIDLLGQLLRDDDSSLYEQTHAAAALWQLAFISNNAKEIKSKQSIIDGKFCCSCLNFTSWSFT